MHLSEEAGRQSILGGLAASGWHTCALLMRMMAESYITNSTSQGSPGIDYVDWKKPVLAGDTISGKSIVLEQRTSGSRPGIGLVKFRHELYNQRGVLVSHGENTVMFLMRGNGGLAA
jgi:acyl dehydratase